MKNIDIKTIFIIILAISLILMFIFRPNKPINEYENEINKLHSHNTELLNKADSLDKENSKLDEKLVLLNQQIDSTGKELTKAKTKIKNLQNKRNETSNIVNTLSGDGVANELTDYIKRRGN